MLGSKLMSMINWTLFIMLVQNIVYVPKGNNVENTLLGWMVQYILVHRKWLGTIGISLHLAKSLKGASVMNSLPFAFLSIKMSVLNLLLWTARVGTEDNCRHYLEGDYVIWKNKPKQIASLLMPEHSCVWKHKYAIAEICLDWIKSNSTSEPRQFWRIRWCNRD